jgi:hypothetical protein
MKQRKRPRIFTPIRPYKDARWASEPHGAQVLAGLAEDFDQPTRGDKPRGGLSQQPSVPRGRPRRRTDIQTQFNDLTIRTEYELTKWLRKGLGAGPQSAIDEMVKQRKSQNRTALLDTVKRAKDRSKGRV